MSNVVIDIITQFTGKKAFKEADNAAAKLTGSVKKLAGALGLAFGARAIVRFATSSAAAFIADEKATSRLTQSVKNLGLALSATDINGYVERLSLQTGVVDDELRPAMQSLLQVTGSVTKSQELLNTAIETSRGSGESLVTVANDLAQAYVGNLKGLRKYNLGLTQAELKAASFEDIQNKLNTLFKGSSKAYLETYAGQWELLTTNAGEAKEVIGKGMIDALMVLTGDTTVEDLAKSMKDFAENTANATVKFAEFAKGLGSAFMPVIDLLQGIYGVFEWIDKNAPKGILEKEQPRPRARRFFTGGQDSVKAGQAAAAERLAKKRADDLIKAQKALLKVQQDALKIKKAGTLFDVEQAGIIAALQNQTSKEDETRLKLQFAILTGNVSEATKLAGEVAKAQGLTKELVAYYSGIPNAKNPFAGWITTLMEAEAIQKRLLALTPKTLQAPPVPETVTPEVQKILDILTGISMTQGVGGDMSDYLYASGPKAGQPVVNVKVTLDGKEMAGAITDIQTNNSLSGSQITLQRTLGQFE